MAPVSMRASQSSYLRFQPAVGQRHGQTNRSGESVRPRFYLSKSRMANIGFSSGSPLVLNQASSSDFKLN